MPRSKELSGAEKGAQKLLQIFETPVVIEVKRNYISKVCPDSF